MILDLETMTTNAVYHTLTQTIIPRPVAWVLTENPAGDYNLAPFSYFTAVCSDPALIMFSVGPQKPDGSSKDTYANIMRNPRFVIHIANSEQAQQVTLSAASLPHGQSEVENCGLTLTDFEGAKLPRVKGSKIAMACSLYQHQEIGNNNQHLIFGKIEKIWLDDDVVSEANGRWNIDAAKVDPIARLGGTEYELFGEILSVPRPA
jgi:flavin reductase (DIM6/NTAB) family NADH-FMN oxidoreductase RutF